MKKTGILFFIVAMLVLAVSCGKDIESKTYYSSIGMLTIKTDSTIIETDAGQRLWVKNPSIIGSDIKDKDRVLLDFIATNETLPTNIDYIIEITLIQKVLLKPVTILTPALEDSVGNDPIQVNSMWLAKDFLNLDFAFYGGTAKHYIHLVRAEGALRTDTIDVEIRHNENEDTGSSGLYSFVSFDLTSLRNNVADSVKLRIKAKEYDDRKFEKIFTYKY